MAVQNRQDPQIKASSTVLFYRITAALLMVAVLAVWILVGMQVLKGMIIPISVTVVAAVGWVVLAVLSARSEARSGLRPEGGIHWDGNIGNPDEENPANN